MNAARARKIDYWIGRPLCWLLSLLGAPRRMFGGREPAGAPRRILFIQLSEMGAAVLARPALERLRARWPKAEFFFWTFAENAPLLEVMGVPKKNILRLRSAGVCGVVVDSLRGLLTLRRARIDAVVDLELFSRLSSILSALCGARRRVGFDAFRMEGLYRGALRTRRVLYNPHLHISENFAALTDALAAPEDEVPMLKLPAIGTKSIPRVNISREERGRVLARLRLPRGLKLVCVHIDLRSRIPLRNWPRENYRALIDRLLERADLAVVMVGGGPGAEAPIVAHARCVNMVGKTGIPELIALFSVSKLLISHDSGLVHMAALTDIAVAALYGPETPALYGPLSKKNKVVFKRFACSPCVTAYNHRDTPCADNRCLQGISVDEVHRAARSLLG